MLKFFKVWAGTIIPLVLILSALAAYVDAQYTDLTWERPASYIWGMFWHAAGLYVLTRMVIQSMKGVQTAPLLLLSFTYQKYLFLLTYAGLALYSAGAIWPSLFGWFNQELIFALFIATTMASAVVNFILLFGWWRGWLEEESDPIPGRPLWRWLRRKR